MQPRVVVRQIYPPVAPPLPSRSLRATIWAFTVVTGLIAWIALIAAGELVLQAVGFRP